MRHGALTRAVRTHDGMDLSGVHREIDPPQDLLAADTRMQVPNFKHSLSFINNY
jgi:hypothetical protein